MLCQSNWCAVRRALRHTVRTWAVVGKNDWQFSNPRIYTGVTCTLFKLLMNASVKNVARV